MQITILGSGSSGNATLIQSAQTAVLIDAGLRIGYLKELLDELTGSISLNGIVLTHCHSDHAAYANQVAQAFDAPVFLTRSTEQRVRLKGGVRRRIFSATDAFRVGAIRFDPLPLPHDVPQVALRFSHRHAQAALVTDLGSVPPSLLGYLNDCHTVLLESNHDSGMLEKGPYPPSIKARVASDRGHLSNAQTAEVLCRLSPRTQRVVLMHLSQKNNHPELAHASAEHALRGTSVELHISNSLPLKFYVPSITPTAPSQQLTLGL